MKKLGDICKRSNSGEVIDKQHWNGGHYILYSCKKQYMLSYY